MVLWRDSRVFGVKMAQFSGDDSLSELVVSLKRALRVWREERIQQSADLPPALMALAFAFTIAREWRGTVVPGIAAHALNNGMLMLFVMLAAGG